MRAHEVFLQDKAEVTREYYESMNSLGPAGELAVALLRTLKRSQKTTGFGFRRVSKRKTESYQYAEAYEWALGELTRVLLTHAGALPYKWGWAAGWLYAEIPTGQVKFVCEDRSHVALAPDYQGITWDHIETCTAIRIIQFCDSVADVVQVGARQRVIKAQERLKEKTTI